ncbi:MAG: hypothetical protein ACOC4M_16530, partial [Promethearchaeia archaeon]
MKQNKQKVNRLKVLLSLTVLLLFATSSFLHLNYQQSEPNDVGTNLEEENNHDILQNPPDISNTLMHNTSGEGASVGAYGFTNGTRAGSYEFDDEWD